MKHIKLDGIYVNRTRIYLVRAFSVYLEMDTMQALNISKPVMWGTYDLKYVHAKKAEKQAYHLFCLIKTDTKVRKSILPVFRRSKYYVDDYPMSLQDTSHCFVVFKIPRDLHRSYDHFLEGRFSQMYTQEQLDRYGITEYEGNEVNPVHAILTKKEQFRAIFMEKLQEVYDVVVDELDDNTEFDSHFVPPTFEGFNTEKHGPKIPRNE